MGWVDVLKSVVMKVSNDFFDQIEVCVVNVIPLVNEESCSFYEWTNALVDDKIKPQQYEEVQIPNISLYGEVECSGIVATNGRSLNFLTINAMAKKIFFFIQV
jgi:hypothetical protein